MYVGMFNLIKISQTNIISQEWLKWCSDTIKSKNQLGFLDLDNFLVKVWGGGGGSGIVTSQFTIGQGHCYMYSEHN